MTTGTTSFSAGLLNGVLNIVEVAVSRGAYKANELSAVGSIVDALHAYGKAQLEAEQAAPAEQADAE